jgi:hypothetical protein
MFEKEPQSIFALSSIWLFAVLTLILACGLGVRLYDLKDPPLDYASTRQLRSALIARGKYYQIASDVPEWKREIALKQGGHTLIEPTIMETIVAGTYWVIGGEYVWIARIYSSLFWVLGGLVVYALAREMVGTDGGIIGLTYYLFAPFGLVASRSFQPDPLMTASIVFAWWIFYRWHRTHTWKWAVLAGLSAGFAMFVKSTAVFFLLGGMGALVLLRSHIKNSLKDSQVWTIGILSALPVLMYNIYGIFIVGSLGRQFKGRIFPQLLSDLQFYRRLKNAMATVAGHELILLVAIIGLVLIRRKEEIGYLVGIWIGYLVYVLAFSYHSTTHYYYHLPLIPLAALSIAGFSNFVFEKVKSRLFYNLVRMGLVLILILGVGGGYYMLFSEDYGNVPYFFGKVTSKVEHDAKIVVLSQDYGNRIAYYGWIAPKAWLGTGDLEYSKLRGGTEDPFEEKFNQFVGNADYFIVTWFNELRRQEKLYNKLYNNYEIYEEGGGYVIFDLHQTIEK